jgi:PAS domain S-box-containing protein
MWTSCSGCSTAWRTTATRWWSSSTTWTSSSTADWIIDIGPEGGDKGGQGHCHGYARLFPALASAKNDHVVLQLKWDHQFQFAGYYAAIWQGYYNDAGINVELRTRIREDGSVLDVVQEVNEGRADFGIGASDILLARDNDIPLVILSSFFQRSAHTLVSLDSVPLNSPADLRGKRIAYQPNAPDAVETDSLLHSGNLTDEDVVKVPFEPGITPLIEGRYDVGAEYPSAALWRAKELGVKVNLLYPSDFETPFYGDTLFAHQRLLDKNPALCRRFRDASIRGWQYAMEHPEEICARIGSELERTLPVTDFPGFVRFESELVRSWMRFPQVEIGTTNSWRWSSVYRQLHHAGLVKGQADLSSLVLADTGKMKSAGSQLWSFAAFIFGAITAIGLLVLFLFTSLRHWALPAMAVVLMVGAIHLIERTQHEASLQRGRLDISNKLGALRSQLVGEIRSDVQLLKGLAANIALRPDLQEDEFHELCTYLTQGHANLRSVVAAPDLVIKHVFPIKGNEAVLGLDYRNHPVQPDAALRALERRDVVVAGPLPLVQGGAGIVMRYPVYIVDPDTAAQKLWGLIGVSIDFNAMLASTGVLGLSLDTDLAIRGKDGMGEQGEVIFGDASVFAAYPVIQEVAFPSGSWQVAAVPRGGWNVGLGTDWTVWAIGLLILSLILLLLIFRERQSREHRENARRLEAVEATRARAQALARVSTVKHNFVSQTVLMSPEFCEMIGLDPEERVVPDIDFLQYVDPADHERIQKIAILSRRTNSKYSFDTQLLRADGRTRRVHLQSEMILDKQGHTVGTFITVQDITERHEAQEALRLSEERFALAMLGSNDSLWDVDLQTLNVYYSPRFREMFGLGPEWNGTTGEAAMAFIHPDDRSRIMSEFASVLANTEDNLETELRAVTPDGRVLDILTRAHIARDEAGNPVRMVGTNVDITPLKDAERETRRLQAQLQQAQKMESIGHLAGGIAHDFNNILASILGFNELATNAIASGSASARIERYLGEVERAAIRARDLVQQLLTFSRPSGAAMHNVAVASVVRDSVKMLRAAVPSSIAMDLDIIDKDVFVLANAVQLHQVVLNLVVNARDAVGENGRIRIEVKRASAGPHTCASCHQRFEGDFVTVTVSDTGEGIAPEHLIRIFEPFFTTKEQGKGTGMGLAVVHGTVHSIGAHLVIDSNLGRGTRVTLYLPLATSDSDESDGALPTPMPRLLKGARILIAEDEDAVAGFMVEALTQAGCHVERRGNGVDALACFEQSPYAFDLVLTDQAMPMMSGVALSEQILKLRPGMPIILVSGYSESVNEATAPAMGISMFLAKPVSLGVLVDAVNRLLARTSDSAGIA